MLNNNIVKLVEVYLGLVNQAGIHASRAMVFGSFTRGEQREDSDIDILVIASEFDTPPSHATITRLWRARRHVDPRIEPIPCGERQWEEDDVNPIIEVARREGQVIPYLPEAA